MHSLSKFNHFQKWQNGHYIAYNARSGAVALMTADNYRSYQNLAEKLSNGSAGSLSPEEQTLLDQLAYGRFAYPAEYDEHDSLKFFHNLHRYGTETIGLILAPTMNCNMACEYCFEPNKKGRMSSQIIEGILAFVEKKAQAVRFVDINWYGGEPLLAMDIIEDIAESLIEMGKEKDFAYTSSMITNGYLLTPENVDRLVELNVSMAQITLDGPKRFHDKKRPLKNGQSSFDTIIKNIAYAVNKMAIGIRVNIDKSFDDEVVGELLGELTEAGLRDKVAIYFGQLEPASEVCANISESCYNANEYSTAEVDYFRKLLEYGFQILRLPSPVTVYCMAQIANAYLIDPDGDIYRCYNHVGDKSKIMGNILNPINYEHPGFTRMFNFSPFDSASCRECSILPICMGGCPAKRIDRELDDEELCETWKRNLESMLEIIVQSRQRQAASVEKE